MERPAVLWPRITDVTEADEYVELRFQSDRVRMRPDVQLRSLVELAVGTRRVSTLSDRSGVHSVRVYGIENRDAARQGLGVVASTLHILNGSDPDMPTVAIALGWNHLPGDEPASRTEIGELEYQAKWKGDANAASTLGALMGEAAKSHAALRSSSVVVCMPSSRLLAGQLAAAVKDALRLPMVECEKIDMKGIQHAQKEDKQFEDAYEKARGSMRIGPVSASGPALIVDDLYQSGGSIAEVTRCLRAIGFKEVYCLVAVKAAWMFRQT